MRKTFGGGGKLPIGMRRGRGSYKRNRTSNSDDGTVEGTILAVGATGAGAVLYDSLKRKKKQKRKGMGVLRKMDEDHIKGNKKTNKT